MKELFSQVCYLVLIINVGIRANIIPLKAKCNHKKNTVLLLHRADLQIKRIFQ